MVWSAPLGRGTDLFTKMCGLWVFLLLLTPQLAIADHPINGMPPTITTMEMPAKRVVTLDMFEEVNGQVANLHLPCSATGMPPPTITWFREDTQIDPTFVAGNGQLSINVTMAEAAREGTIYYCVATNMIGPGNSIRAAVRSRDIIVTHTYFGGFTHTEARVVNITTDVGDSVALECDFEPSNPTPQVRWLRGPLDSLDPPSEEITQDLSDNNRLILDGGRYLFIRVLTTEDRNRRYQCEVTNFPDGRAPTRYSLDGNFINDDLVVYKELGTEVAVLGDMTPVRFVFAAGARGVSDIVVTDCAMASNIMFSVSSRLVVLATLGMNVPEDQPEVQFSCNLVVGTTRSQISGTVTLSRPASLDDLPTDAPPVGDRERLVGGGAVVYPCAASGTPAPTVTWYYNGGPLGSGAEVDESGTLTIAEPLVDNSGIYQCIVTNAFGMANRTWSLEVREPVFPVISPLTDTSGAVEDRLEGTVIVQQSGMPALISTVVTSDPCPSVRWTFRSRSGTMIDITNGADYTISNPCSDDELSSSYNFTLTITSLTAEMSGNYAAQFTVLDTVVTTERLFVTIPVDIMVLSLDFVIDSDSSPAPMCLLEGSSVTFTCNMSGFPRPEIIFRRGPQRINPGGRVTQLSNDQIRISNINASDEGQYTCEANIPAMDGAPARTISLNPTPPQLDYCTFPEITGFTFTEDPREGSELLLECEVEGVPMPTVTWTRDNVTLDANDPNVFISISPDHQVMIDSANREDSGVYSCRATNPAGSLEQSMRIDVQPRDLSDVFTTPVIIGIVAGGAGLILLIVLLVLLLICVYICARRKSGGSADFTGYSYPAVSGDGRGNVDDDSYDGGQPEEAFEPDYDSVPTRRPNEPPPYKDTPGYQHGAPLAGDDMEMMKYPPPDAEFVTGGQPPYLRPDNGYRQTPNAEDFLSEDAQFV